MKKKALHKDFFMEIRKSFARFISIFFIVALGVAFFSGIQSASPDMRYTGDAYFDAQQLMDLKVVSTLGLNEENLEALRKLPGVIKAEGGVGIDVLTGEGSSRTVLHVESISDTLNQVSVDQGRKPDKAGECFLDSSFFEDGGYALGDTLEFSTEEESEEDKEEDEEELLKVKKYTIVGAGHSPMYISFSRGNTNLGSGKVDGFAYVTRDNFNDSYDTQAYIQAKGSVGLTSYTDLYDNLVGKIKDQVKGIEEEQCQVRYDQVRGDAQEKVDDARKELDDGKKEADEKLADAKKKLDDAKKELKDGKKKIKDGEKQLADAKVQLADGEKQLADARVQLADGEKQLADAKAQLADGQAQLDQGKAQLADGQAQLKEAYDTLAAKQAEADAAKAQLEDGWSQQKAGQAQLEEQKKAYEDGIATLEQQREQLSQSKEALEAAKVQYEQAAASGTVPQEQLDAMAAQIAAGEAGIAQGEQAIASAQAQLDASKPQLDAAQAQLDDVKAKLTASQKEFDDGAAQLAAGWEEYHAKEQEAQSAQAEIEKNEQALLDARAQIAASEEKLQSGRQEIQENEAKLSDARAEISKNEKKLEDARQDLADGQKKYEDGRQEYKDAKKDAEEEIADGEEKLADAQKKIDDIKMPEWIITDRDDLPEYADYGSNADRIRNIGQVFPVLFFLVAALISLTTMTRMVEEQRTQIGTMKAMGYGKYSIISKYLNYAFLATVGGSVLGVLIGEKILPYIIIKAYGIMYHNMDAHLRIHYEFKYALIASVGAVLCTTVATFSSCVKELAETPASLMRPPAPKEGKRVLMERVTFIWKHLSFTWKSTVRNLFRYKKRFFMTIFGIGGCMALLLVGFGLRDSIMDIAVLQYSELQTYDMMVVGDEDASAKEKEQLHAYLEEQTGDWLEGYTDIMFRQLSAKEDKVKLNIYLDVVEHGEDLEGNVNLRDRRTKESFSLTDAGAVISEKTAKLMDVSAGDFLSVEDDGVKYEIPVAGITENYMAHYVYMTQALYEQVFGKPPVYNDILLRVNTEKIKNMETIGPEILHYPAALSISYTSSLRDQLDRMLETLDMVMFVLIVSAGMLAFVVLYNLNNINITERKRELATLKVLGFYDVEVSEYVFRENALLTIFGVLAGVAMGIVLHRYVITTVEVDAVMFGRNINWPSFLYSILFTCGFSVFVNFVMYFKLKKINMVESLKSVE
ncbi:MAG: FtsX-like permease family protein [Blautia sp.]|jgi:putative ABC transport system permease protein